MRVIKPGVRPEPEKRELITETFTCDNCGCVFEANEKDGHYVMIEYKNRIFHMLYRRYKNISCPTCYEIHRLYLDKKWERCSIGEM